MLKPGIQKGEIRKEAGFDVVPRRNPLTIDVLDNIPPEEDKTAATQQQSRSAAPFPEHARAISRSAWSSS
jgi:hypothetical protein